MPDRLSPLSDLRQCFAKKLERLEEEFRRKPSAGRQAIDEVVAEISRRVNGTGNGQPPRDRLREAVELVFNKGIKAAFNTHARYVFWVLLEPWEGGLRLIDDRQRLDDLSAEIYTSKAENRLRARDWGGLLMAYFTCQDKGEGWQCLRLLLNKTLPHVSRDKFIPDWLAFLDQHPTILGGSPTLAYAPDVLAGRNEIIERLRDELRIPPESWFWAELLLSQVNLVCNKDDEQYKVDMEKLLAQLEDQQYQLVRDDALKSLLNRYKHSRWWVEAHVQLRDCSLRVWGSPHLERNSKWGLVEPEVKKMVRSWFTRQALDDFFHLLAEDGQAEDRRLRFWLDYQGSIDEFHFALGPSVDLSQEIDYRKIREKYSEHFCKLTNPGNLNNNAFLLTLGNYTIVEFGVTGNACYCYESNNLPFALRDNVDLNLLKNKDAATKWLSHRGDRWEKRFRETLSNFGIYPDQESKIDSAVKIARQRGIVVKDERSKGGVLWIIHAKQDDDVASKLESLGFKYYGINGWCFND